MSENGAAMPNGVWKWIAAVLIAVMLAGAPSIIQAIKAPSQEEVDLIRERQNIVLQRLAGIDIYITQNRELLLEIRDQLQLHDAETRK